MFTHPNQGKFEVKLTIYRFELNIYVDSGEAEFHDWSTDNGWHFSVTAPNWIKIGARVECILGVLGYIVDIDVDKRYVGGLSIPVLDELDDSTA